MWSRYVLISACIICLWSSWGWGPDCHTPHLAPTHHALEDIAWLRAIPGMTILCPADAVETRCALRAALAHDGPVYLRLGKKNEPAVHAGEPDFEIGRNIPLRGGEDACILAVGTVTPTALDAARLLEERSISCAVTGHSYRQAAGYGQPALRFRPLSGCHGHGRAWAGRRHMVGHSGMGGGTECGDGAFAEMRRAGSVLF